MKNIYEYDGDDNRLYYTCEPLQVGRLERQWLNHLKREIAETSEYDHNVIVNLTWFKASWEETETLRQLVDSLSPKEQVKIWFVGSVDGNDWITHAHFDFYHHFVNQKHNISFVGYSGEHWHSWYPFWFIDNNDGIDPDKLLLKPNPEYLYLSYNRKPKIHRELLVEGLIKNNLLDRGWVTYERGRFPEIDVRTGESDQDRHSSDIRFSRPEDITSLGNMNRWRNSYLNIVSETEHSDPWQLSEKTWKPIFGLRPFLINGHNESYNVLDRLGFYTPRDLFKNSKLDCSHESAIKQIQALYTKTPEQVYDLWVEQYDMLVHNRKRMYEMAYSNPTKILNWSQAASKS